MVDGWKQREAEKQTLIEQLKSEKVQFERQLEEKTEVTKRFTMRWRICRNMVVQWLGRSAVVVYCLNHSDAGHGGLVVRATARKPMLIDIIDNSRAVDKFTESISYVFRSALLAPLKC